MAIDAEETKNMLFGVLPKSKTPKLPNLSTSEVAESEPKWRRLEKVTVLMTGAQKDALDEMARKLMRFRVSGDERITANTIIRALLDVTLPAMQDLPLSPVSDEKELAAWLRQLL